VRYSVRKWTSANDRKRNTVIVTDGRGSLRSSVTAVWGPKALENVLDINLELDVGIDRLMAKREGLDTSYVVPEHLTELMEGHKQSKSKV
jgi:DNA mismatch repair protein PMS2